MRFSENGFYVERYVKCRNCGLLVYGDGVPGTLAGKPALFCSDWCLEWADMKAAGIPIRRLPIVHPKLPVEEAAGRRAVPRGTPDMVMMNILDSTMVSICREMGILLMKTSY